MAFKIKEARNKSEKTNRSIYLPQKLIDALNQIALDHDTSFNNLVYSILDDFIKNPPEFDSSIKDSQKE